MYKTTSFARISSVCAPFREYIEPLGQGMFFRYVRNLRDGFTLALLHHRTTGKEIVVAGVHLAEDQNWPDARIAQAHVLCETIHTFLLRQSRPLNLPSLLLGDFASFWKKWTTDKHDKWVEDRYIVSGVYSLLTEGLLDVSHSHHPFVRNHEGTIKGSTIKGLQFTTSNFVFESAYCRARGMEPSITKCTPYYKDVSDYLFYTPETIDTVSTLRLPYKADPATLPRHLKLLPMPNAHFPSNHIPIGATLTLKS